MTHQTNGNRKSEPIEDFLARIPPHAMDAEQSVLGAMLLDARAIDELGDCVREEDFYQDANQRIFAIMRHMRDKNKTIDPVTVCEVLAKAKILEECGGPAYLHHGQTPWTPKAGYGCIAFYAVNYTHFYSGVPRHDPAPDLPKVSTALRNDPGNGNSEMPALR